MDTLDSSYTVKDEMEGEGRGGGMFCFKSKIVNQKNEMVQSMRLDFFFPDER